MDYYTRTSCRNCESKNLYPFLSLGKTPLANSFLKTPDEFPNEPFYPLEVFVCKECFLVQLLDVVDPKLLFQNYLYVTGTSDTMEEHNRQYAHKVCDKLKLGPSDLVMEVASNDGSLLKCFQKLGVRTLGIEPASNISEMANKNGIKTINRFFNFSASSEIREQFGLAKAIMANNVLAHVDGTKGFLKGCKNMLEENGLLVVEVPYLRDMLDKFEYDTIYHEHLCYFSIWSVVQLCESVGLTVLEVERVPVHGGSLRIFAGREEKHKGQSKVVLEMLEEEKGLGLVDLERYKRFGEEVNNNRGAIVSLLESLKGKGYSIAGYGAPAKGNTLMNFCKINSDLVAYTVDRNPMKVDLFTPGMHIPVLPVETLMERRPDFVLILAWNFADEIIKQQKEFINMGGRFIVPIPEPRVI